MKYYVLWYNWKIINSATLRTQFRPSCSRWASPQALRCWTLLLFSTFGWEKLYLCRADGYLIGCRRRRISERWGGMFWSCISWIWGTLRRWDDRPAIILSIWRSRSNRVSLYRVSYFLWIHLHRSCHFYRTTSLYPNELCYVCLLSTWPHLMMRQYLWHTFWKLIEVQAEICEKMTFLPNTRRQLYWCCYEEWDCVRLGSSILSSGRSLWFFI